MRLTSLLKFTTSDYKEPSNSLPTTKPNENNNANNQSSSAPVETKNEQAEADIAFGGWGFGSWLQTAKDKVCIWNYSRIISQLDA